MHFRVKMTKKGFMHIIDTPKGTVHEIVFGHDRSGPFKADKRANLVFEKKADDFTDNPDEVKSVICTVNDGKRSLVMLLTLYPKYGSGKGIVRMRQHQATKKPCK